MVRQEDEKTKLKRVREKEAIALAMQSRWKEAIAVNRALLKLFPTDVEAYNRLGRASMELGEYAEAKQAYSQALELDPNNSIARKNLRRLSHLSEAQPVSIEDQHRLAPHLFIEEAGKTGVVNLVHLAPRVVIAKMSAGAQVNLKLKGHNLIVENGQREYLGQVEPKHGSRLIKLIKAGNKYVAAIASSEEQEVKVIITEIYQHPSQAGHLSFPPKVMEGFRPYTKDGLLRHELEEEEGYAEEGEEEEGLAEETKSYQVIEVEPVEEEETEPSEE